jgi:hypothetical protein
MTSPRYARLASKVLARIGDAPGLPQPRPTPEARAAAAAAIERAIGARVVRRRVRRWVAASAVAVVALLAVLGGRRLAGRRSESSLSAASPVASTRSFGIVAHPVGIGARVVVSGAPAQLVEQREIVAGSRVVTPPTGRAALTFSTGTRIEVSESTDMTVSGDGALQALRLEAGSIELDVVKLSELQRFVVDTPDAEVEVRGTQFRVSVVPSDASCGEGSPTRVTVTEGVVVVRRAGAEVRIMAGSQWPSGCVRPSSAGPAVRKRTVATPPAEVESPAATSPSAVSTLAEQNDLFSRAVTAKRRGDARAALEMFDHFLAQYGASALAESAAVERMRLLRATSVAQGATAAASYLARYPGGFARGEAEALGRSALEPRERADDRPGVRRVQPHAEDTP